MSSKSGPQSSAEHHVREIRHQTPKRHSTEDKIRIVLKGPRGECSIAELCRREGIDQSLYYKWSKEFLEAGKKRLSGDTERQATSHELKDLRRDMSDLKEAFADVLLENHLLKKSMIEPLSGASTACRRLLRARQAHLIANRKDQTTDMRKTTLATQKASRSNQPSRRSKSSIRTSRTGLKDHDDQQAGSNLSRSTSLSKRLFSPSRAHRAQRSIQARFPRVMQATELSGSVSV